MTRLIPSAPQTLGALAFAAVLVVAAIGGAPGLVAGQEDVPASYYGDVEINGDPAPEGTEIAAVVDGEVKDTIVVETAGAYGGSDLFDEKLVVDEPSGTDTVEFVVDDVTAEESVTWEEGDVREVDLTFEGVDTDSLDDSTDAADDTDTGGSGASGGGTGSDDTGTDDTTDSDSDDAGATDTDDTADAVDDTTDDSTDAIDDEAVETIQEADASIDVDPDTDRSQASFGADEPVESITFDGDLDGSVSVTTSDGTPDGVERSPGTALQVSEITVPDDATDAPATIRTSVTADRLTDLDTDAESLTVLRLVDGEWQSLETTVVDDTDDRVVLEAETPGFSYFSVSATSEPDAAASVTPESIDEGEDVTLDGSDSTDEYGEIVAYEWTVDGETLSGETATLALDEPGEYTAELTVTNDAGETDTATAELSVAETSADAGATGDDTDDAPDEEPAGLGMTAIGGLLVAVILAVIAVGVWRRGSDDDPLR